MLQVWRVTARPPPRTWRSCSPTWRTSSSSSRWWPGTASTVTPASPPAPASSGTCAPPSGATSWRCWTWSPSPTCWRPAAGAAPARPRPSPTGPPRKSENWRMLPAPPPEQRAATCGCSVTCHVSRVNQAVIWLVSSVWCTLKHWEIWSECALALAHPVHTRCRYGDGLIIHG